MQTRTQTPHPPIVTREEWLAKRKALLQQEKELTKQKDRVNAERRRLPMVKVEKPYEFEGEEGKVSLLDLFKGKRQLIVYHFMFDPSWDKGCGGCASYVDSLGDLSELEDNDTRLVLVSRAPLPKLLSYKESKGWRWPWYSSFGSDFNYDFHVTLDPSRGPVEYNYWTPEEIRERGLTEALTGEEHGTSVFFQMDGDVFHTYSNFARGTEGTSDAYGLLDLTPYGRQQDFEDSPPGWPQHPTYG